MMTSYSHRTPRPSVRTALVLLLSAAALLLSFSSVRFALAQDTRQDAPQAAPAPPAELVIASEEWPGYTNGDGSGLYWEILKTIFAPKRPIKSVIRSYLGSKRLLEQGKVDAMLGGYARELAGRTRTRMPLDFDELTAVWPVTRQIDWQGEQTLQGGTCIWISGYDMQSALSVDVGSIEVDDRLAGFRALNVGHADFLLDDKTELLQFMATNGLDTGYYVLKTFKTLCHYVAFQNTAQGRELAAWYDARYAALRESGELGAIYARHGEDYSDVPLDACLASDGPRTY